MADGHVRASADDTSTAIPGSISGDSASIDGIVGALRDARGVVLDCGAHAGDFSCLLANRGVTGPIHAFEPQPGEYQLLVEKSRKHPNVLPIHAAVGSASSVKPLSSRRGNAGRSMVPEGPAGLESLDVRAVDLYEYIRNLERVALLKLDLAGLGPDILDRMPDDVLGKIHLLVTEGHRARTAPGRLREAGFWLWQRGPGSPGNRVYRRDLPWAVGKKYRRADPSMEPPRVLMVAHVDKLGRRMSRNLHDRSMGLARHGNVTLTGPGCPGFVPGMHVQELLDRMGKADFIIHGEDVGATGVPLVKGLESIDIPKAVELIDSWENAERRQAFLRDCRFDYCFHAARPWESSYEAHCPGTKLIWTPNAVRTDVFRDYGLDKENDLLLYGATFEWYPLRVRLRRLLERLASGDGLRVSIIPHPGYWDNGYTPQEGHYVGEKLAREINRSWITIATGSVHQCLFVKHLEALACRSLAAGSVPDQARPLLGQGFADLADRDDNAIVETIHELLRDKEKLTARIEDGYRRVRTGLSVERYADNLLALVSRLV